MRVLLASISSVSTIAALLAACSGDDTSSAGSGTPGGSTGSGGGSTTISCTDAPAELSLEGTWAALGRLDVKLKGNPGGAITLCPTDQAGEATMLLLVTVKQDGTKLTEVKSALCSIELPIVTALVGDCDPMKMNLVSTQISASPALATALPTVPAIPATGTLAGTGDGAGVSIEGLKVTVGSTKSGTDMATWKVADDTCSPDTLGRTNQCEAMCVTDCTSMRDDDGDGYPGVTVEVCGFTDEDTSSGVKCNAENPSQTGASVQGRGFIDIEVAPKLTGNAKSSCEVSGNVDTPILYNVVGADVYLGPGKISVTSAIKSLPTFTVDPSTSSFRMVRIDGQYGAPNWKVDASQVAAACKTITDNVNQLN